MSVAAKDRRGPSGASTDARRKLAAVSIDLDEIHHYRAIHGLPPSREAAHAAYDVAIDRAVELARDLGIALTFFAVGDDLARAENRAKVASVTMAGHQVESHSMSHRYDLTRASRPDVRAEIEGSFDVIENATGRRPRGFRAPGYTMSDAVMEALEEAGASFDSSVFPCPPYYFGKLGVLAAMALRGRSSASIVGSPKVLLAPTEPYRLGRTYTERGMRSLVEIPIRVTRGLRFPVIGSTVGLGGERGARALVTACGPVRTFNLELHAIDFLDTSDGLEDLVSRVAELRRPLDRRVRALRALVGSLLESGYEFTSLAEIANAERSIGNVG